MSADDVPAYRADPDRWRRTAESLRNQGIPAKDATQIASMQEACLALTAIIAQPDRQ